MQFAMLFLLQNFPYTKIIPKRHGTQADFFDFFELFLTYFAAGLCIQCMLFNEMHKNFHAFCPKPPKEKSTFLFTFSFPCFVSAISLASGAFH